MSDLQSTAQSNGTGSRRTREEAQLARYTKCFEGLERWEKRDLKLVSHCLCTGLDGCMEMGHDEAIHSVLHLELLSHYFPKYFKSPCHLISNDPHFGEQV
jgi:hypothetical protein